MPRRRRHGYDGAVTDQARTRAAGPRCPTCDRVVAWADNPARPFCSVTRRLLDPGGRLNETFRVPSASLSLPVPSAPDGIPADE